MIIYSTMAQTWVQMTILLLQLRVLIAGIKNSTHSGKLNSPSPHGETVFSLAADVSHVCGGRWVTERNEREQCVKTTNQREQCEETTNEPQQRAATAGNKCCDIITAPKCCARHTYSISALYLHFTSRTPSFASDKLKYDRASL